MIIAALVGAKALLFIVDFEHFTSSWQEFTTLLRSGGVFYGGLIAAIVVCIWQLRKHRLPLWPSGDLFAPGIALGYMVGRLGCLMAGCCYGKPTDVAWAVTFTDPAANFNVGTPLNVPLHPPCAPVRRAPCGGRSLASRRARGGCRTRASASRDTERDDAEQPDARQEQPEDAEHRADRSRRRDRETA